jgi:hypothetical protein
MTEQTFVSAGFEMNVIHPEESGCDSTFYYYTLDIGDICLITNSSDEADKEGWWCSIFDSDTLKIKGEGDLLDIVRILELNTHG